MQRRPDFLTVLIVLFGLGVVITGVSASQPKTIDVPNASQMPGIVAEYDFRN